MPFDPYLIEEFDDLVGLHEVVGYGNVRRPTDGPLEVQIEVLLAALTPDGNFHPGRRTEGRWIGCGQLDTVPIGSRWNSRQRVGERKGLRRMTASILSCVDSKVVGESIKESQTPLFPMGKGDDHPCFRLTLDCEQNSTSSVKHPTSVHVPIMEVIRAVFGLSSAILVQMFTGVRDKAVAPDSSLFDRTASDYVKPDHYRLICYRKLSDDEARIGAGIMTSDHIRKSHDLIFQNAASDRWLAPEGTPIKTEFPFENGAELTFEYRWTAWKRADGKIAKRALITRIFAFEIALGCKELDVVYPQTERDENLPPSQSRSVVTNATRYQLQSRSAPKAGMPAVTMATEGPRIRTSAPLTINHKPRPPRKLPEIGIRDVLEDQERSAATGDRQKGGDPNVTHASVRRKNVRADDANIIEALTNAFDAVSLAVSARPQWSIVNRPADGTLPITRVGDRKSGFDVLLVQVRTPNGDFLVIDRGVVGDGGPSLGLIAKSSMLSNNLGNLPFPEICDFVVKNCGKFQRKKLPGHVIKAVTRRIETRNDLSRYADLIARGMAELVARAR